MQYSFCLFCILECYCNTVSLLFFMLKFLCGWKLDFEDRRPNEDVNNSAAMESTAGI